MPENCKIHLGPNFEDSLDRLLAFRAHNVPSGKKGRTVKRNFEEFLGDIVARIANNPECYEEEEWPEEYIPPKGYTFRKAREWFMVFKDPGRLVRLMYMVNATRDEATLVWVYTHAQFGERPAEGDLMDMLDAVFDDHEDGG